MKQLVSVPLRGLSSWKDFLREVVGYVDWGFSPLAGIKFVESSLNHGEAI